jgi:hypothetical protein
MTTETARSFYRRQGWNPGYGHKVKTLGRLVTVNVDGKELVDVEASVAKLAATADPAKSHMAEVNERQRALHRGTATPQPLPQTSGYQAGTSDSKNATYMQAKTAREVYEAKNAQLEYEERIGKLWKSENVKKVWIDKVSVARDSLLQIPARVGPIVAAQSDLQQVVVALEKEIRQVLEDLSRDPNYSA